MDFREYAGKEATASVRRIQAAQVDVCRKQLGGLRAALDAAAKALEAAATPSPEAERDVADLVDRLTKTAVTAAEQAAKRVADEAQKAQDALRGEMQTHVNEKKALVATLKDAQALAEATKADLAKATQRADGTARDLEQARDAHRKLEESHKKLEEAYAKLEGSYKTLQGTHSALGDTHNKLAEAHRKLDSEHKKLEDDYLNVVAARDEEHRGRTAAEAELHTSRELVEKTRVQLAGANKAVETSLAEKALAEDTMTSAQSAAQAAEAKLLAVTDLLKSSNGRVKTLERGQQESERRIRELEASLASKPASPAAAGSGSSMRESLSLLDELLAAFQALSRASTIGDVLTTTLEHLAGQFDRVAMFRVKSNHLQGEHQIGFDLKTDIGKVVIPLGMDSLLAKAAGTGEIERLSAEELKDSSRVPFSGTPSCAIALPIVVGEETLAIIYADDSGSTGDRSAAAADLRTRFADAVLRHTVALLIHLKAELKMLNELRAYAGSLLQEIESMHTADVAGGKSGKELHERLKVNLDYARSIYANRVELEGADAAGLLDDAIGSAVAVQPPTPFGRDLAVVAGLAAPAAKRA
jgi:hypothetical protein